jgi:hypothetical protein
MARSAETSFFRAAVRLKFALTPPRSTTTPGLCKPPKPLKLLPSTLDSNAPVKKNHAMVTSSEPIGKQSPGFTVIFPPPDLGSGERVRMVRPARTRILCIMSAWHHWSFLRHFRVCGRSVNLCMHCRLQLLTPPATPHDDKQCRTTSRRLLLDAQKICPA